MNRLSCGETTAPESCEHGFSKWLLKYIRAVRTPITHFSYAIKDGSQKPRMEKMILNSFKLRRICENCNHQWMSRLETAAKPIVIGLMDHSLSPESLDDEQRRLLARWAGKTATIESYAVGAERPINPNILHVMRQYEEGPPGNFGVLALSTKFIAIGHMQIGAILDLLAGECTALENIVILVLPNLILICAFPIEELPCQYFCDLNEYIPIWPERRHWQQMSVCGPPLPPPTQQAEFLVALAKKIELKLFYR